MILSGKDIHLEESKSMSKDLYAGETEAMNHSDKDLISEWEVTEENGRKYVVRGTILSIWDKICGSRTTYRIVDGIDEVRIFVYWGSRQLQKGWYFCHHCRRIRPASEQTT
jgi:hypothetical protein